MAGLLGINSIDLQLLFAEVHDEGKLQAKAVEIGLGSGKVVSGWLVKHRANIEQVIAFDEQVITRMLGQNSAIQSGRNFNFCLTMEAIVIHLNSSDFSIHRFRVAEAILLTDVKNVLPDLTQV